MVSVDYVETIYKVVCPNKKCKTINFVNDGNHQDMTVEDTGGVRCFACKCEFALGERFDDEDDSIYFQDGVPKEKL